MAEKLILEKNYRRRAWAVKAGLDRMEAPQQIITEIMETIIYHNPKCYKSRQTLQLMEERGIKHKIIEYLKTPPSKTEMNKILDLLGLEPRQLMRKQEPEYGQAKLDNANLTHDALIDAM